jgi:hypothetical protein
MPKRRGGGGGIAGKGRHSKVVSAAAGRGETAKPEVGTHFGLVR